METVASNSTRPDSRAPHPVAGRIVRAIQNRLLLLHRAGPSFYVLGATGNVYNVILSTTPTCTCPDRMAPCKHILFVLIRVLGVPVGDPCLHRKTLRPCHVGRLLSARSLPESLAGPGLQEVFHRHFSGPSTRKPLEPVHVEDGSICPVCLDEIHGPTLEGFVLERVVVCRTCRNPIHEECLMKWKRSRGRRPAVCVMCRARWKDINNKVGLGQDNKYVNLAAYLGEDFSSGGGRGGGGSCGD